MMQSIEYCNRGGYDGHKNMTEILHTVGSDYSGGYITMSNYRTIKAVLIRRKGVYDLYGWYGTYGLAYDPEEITAGTKAVIDEIVDGLESYPLYDEDHFSALEHEARGTYIDELKRELGRSRFDEYSVDEINAIFDSAPVIDYLWNNIHEDGAATMYLDDAAFFDLFFPARGE